MESDHDAQGDRDAGPTNPAGSVSVYVVDDQGRALAVLVELIDNADGLRVVGSSTSATTAASEIVSLRPAVAVVDGNIAGRDGLEVCRQVKARAPGVACVIVTTGVGATWTEAEVAAAGVVAVVLKQIVDFPLLDVIARAAAGQSDDGANR